jgi:hypothetical protein
VPVDVPEPADLIARVRRALIWGAAFCFASAIFLCSTLLIRNLPPTAPVAIGRVTVERASKAQDYAGALLFFLIVPAATVWLARVGQRADEALRRKLSGQEGLQNLVSLLFVAPYFFAPFFYLTTFKWGWVFILPLTLSLLVPRLIIFAQQTRWFRVLFAEELLPFHALICVEALAWMLFRYITTGRRIAHIPTLFLEVVFVLFFLLIFWAAAVINARIASFTLGMTQEVALQRLAVAFVPLTLLPVLGLLFVNPLTAMLLVAGVTAVALVLALRNRTPLSSRAVRNLVVYAIVPMLLYAANYASTASLSQWIDLFHRGESLGPASDYLRGKVPYRDVFVLHGLLEDGMLDAWLMQLFGRDVAIALARPVILGSFAVPAAWYLGMAIFDSIGLSLAVILLGAVTTVDNERTFFEIAVIALLLWGLRTKRRGFLFAAGVVAAIAFFFSFDIGVYSIGGAALLFAALAIGRRMKLTEAGGALPFTAGLVTGSAPFVAYLAIRGGFAAFVETTFVTLPRIIDAVWSLPYPNLTSTFRRDLNLHTISDFLLFEPFRYILNPLVIAIATIVVAVRLARRRVEWIDVSLAALALFAAITQRSALGRADFRHQYFSAFLIAPMIVILALLAFRSARPLWLTRDRAAQAFLVTVGLAMIPPLFVALWVPDLLNARLDDIIRYQPRVLKLLPMEPAAGRVQDRIAAVSEAIEDIVRKKSDPIFDFSNQPAFYFFGNRPNPTRFYQIPIASPPAFQREAIERLERAKPRLVLRRSPEGFDNFDGIDNRLRAPAISRYLDDRYRFIRLLRGVELWVRNGETSPVDVQAYLRRITLPSKKEINDAGVAQVVFPSIGSTPGIDAYWHSDLMIHNPFADSLSFRLRYVSEDRKVERELTLGAGQTMRWDDVVASYFFAPGTSGVLWITHPANRQPVCRVRTYDAQHNGKASLYDALSLRDAANGDTDLKDLTLVGLNGAAARINLGIVNMGDSPGSFRITARDSRGRLIGVPIDAGVEEGSSYLLVDAGRALRVQLDETTAVHVELKRGLAIAYASSIEGPNHDTQFVAAVPSLLK